MEKTMRKITELKEWDKNPRNITEKDFERLKKQITKLGQYKPLLITPDGTVIGGNMRLRAYKALGINDVWVSIVEPKDENEKLEYALSDNDRAGYYDADMLANMMPNYQINWTDYAIDLNVPMNIEDIIANLGKSNELNPEYSQKLGEVIYEPKETHHQPADLFQVEHKFDADIEKVQNPELKELFKIRAANFTQFDFEKLADYYAYQATPEEKKVFERLALVLLDRDKLIENGFSKLITNIDLSEEEYEDKT